MEVGQSPLITWKSPQTSPPRAMFWIGQIRSRTRTDLPTGLIVRKTARIRVGGSTGDKPSEFRLGCGISMVRGWRLTAVGAGWEIPNCNGTCAPISIEFDLQCQGALLFWTTEQTAEGPTACISAEVGHAADAAGLGGGSILYSSQVSKARLKVTFR